MRLSKTQVVRSIRGKITPVLVRALMSMISGMSRPAQMAFARRLGILVYYLVGSHRRRSLHNLNIVFGKTKSRNEIKALAKASFQDFAKTGFEMVWVDSSPREVMREFVTLEGKEHLEKALSRGKGVIALTAHFGNFIVLHGRLGIEGYKINCVVKAMRDKGVEDIIQRMRTDQDMNTIYVHPNAQCVKACHSALAANEILVLLNDQPQKNGVQVDFFGLPVWTAPGPASLALTTEAAVVPMFIIRNPDDTHSMIISEELKLIRTGDKKQDLAVNTQAFTKITESYVLRHPEQWAWNQRRWRRQGE